MQGLVKQALTYCLSDIDEIIPKELSEKLGLVSRARAFSMIHDPKNPDMPAKAAAYFTVEEMYTLALDIERRKSQNARERARVPKILAHMSDVSEITKNLPFELTRGQLDAVGDVMRDLARAMP